MAACLRSVYMGDPFSTEEGALPEPPSILREQVSVSASTIGGVRCAIYSPIGTVTALPLLLYMHGGGFVVGCSEDTDYITRMLCRSNNIVVVSVNYRLAPETVFPGALDDCERVLQSLLTYAERYSIDPDVVFLCGDSAGANLAASLSHRLGKSTAAPKGLILLAPWLDMELESYSEYNRLAAKGIVFDAPFLAYARAAYTDFDKWTDPFVSPIGIPPGVMPPTIVLTGSADPLVGQTLKLNRNALNAECTHIQTVVYEGMPHCFYSFPNLFAEEQDCFRQIAEFVAATR